MIAITVVDSAQPTAMEKIKIRSRQPPPTVAEVLASLKLRGEMQTSDGWTMVEADAVLPPDSMTASEEAKWKKFFQNAGLVPAYADEGYSQMSQASYDAAVEIVTDLGLELEDGAVADLPPVPTEWMDKAADFEFNYSLYANEDEGAEDLCEHHQDKLEKLGVKFGRGGLKIVDTHKKKLGLTLKTKTGKIYRGGVDSCLTPFHTAKAQAYARTRAAWEHRQSIEDRKKYCLEHNLEVPTPTSKDDRGQAIVALLGACATNNIPLDLSLFDGHLAVLLRLSKRSLTMYNSLTPLQMYVAMAATLKEREEFVYKRYIEEADIAHFADSWGAARKRVREPLEGDEPPLQRLRDIQSMLESRDEKFDFALEYLNGLQFTLPPEPMSPEAMNPFE